MTALRSVFRSVENPSRPLTDTTLLELFGGWKSHTGRQVSVEGSMRVGAAFRGAQIIAMTGGGLPFKAYRHSDRSPVTTSVLTRDRSMTPLERWSTVIAHMVLWGNGYIFKRRDAAGNVRALLPIHPSRVFTEIVETDIAEIGYTKKFTVDGALELTNYEITHVMGLSLDGITGLGPISYVREAFGIALTAEEAAARLYGQGMMLSGILTTDQPLAQEQANALKDRWKAKLLGIQGAHDVAILDRGAKFQSLSMPPADAQFLDSRKFQITEIARLLGLPGWMLNDQEKSTSWGTGMEQQFTTWVQLTLQMYLSAIGQRVTMDVLPDSQYAEFTVEGLLRGDAAARAAFYGSGIQHGWLVPNDVRPRENLPPVPWGNEPYLPFNAQSAPSGGD
jgi:HK97 family phage portal protein